MFKKLLAFIRRLQFGAGSYWRFFPWLSIDISLEICGLTILELRFFPGVTLTIAVMNFYLAISLKD